MAPQTVLVTGAGGKTGGLTLKNLLEQADLFKARALVHSEQSADRVAGSSDISRESIFTADITDASDSARLREAMQGAHAVVIATSAVPQLVKSSLFGVLVKKATFGFGPGQNMPSFWFKQEPEQVDWVGQKNQIDAAKAAGVKHVVLVSSMGVTDPDCFLNKNFHNICIWKRKAEKYLLESGLDYTIIHPGGLSDGTGGQQGMVVGVDDSLMKSQHKKIHRADVAMLCVAALKYPEYRNRSFDVIASPDQAAPDFSRLLKDFTANCDYAKGATEPAS